ncbi:MAG: hypothetical protein A2826_01860 [Candidatus Doudnabacteria bacterium RIFCSPHIGHO2_01_FULL_43_23]|uniref:Uncharacterized protein n=1 Tax=Candidatus Doudnabacteria bacterium RIFCSPHIGHO2_01_FULL_43_23 TaxID=1817822 RepID=A0A1F5NVD2_9BACT|nr:MAG: hypothetical protein A2826_01860 [Candidatus Doudnabacteria bacterium RIFCSPHIGHO2_01_FULL_43_23]
MPREFPGKEGKWYSIIEAANRLKLTRTTVYRWFNKQKKGSDKKSESKPGRKKGKPVSVRIIRASRGIYIHESSLDSLCDQRSQEETITLYF